MTTAPITGPSPAGERPALARLLHDMPHLASASVHADPAPTESADFHEALRHHEEARSG